MILQSSQFSDFMACPRLWYYKYDLMRTRPPSMQMEAGSCFHNMNELHSKFKVPLEDLYDALPEERQQFHEMIFPVFLEYLKRDAKDGYKTIELNGEPAIETEFSLILSPNVTYKGKIDRIAEKNGMLYFMDWKYTSSYLNPMFFGKFEVSPQVLSYSYVGNHYFNGSNGLPALDGFIIDAASLAKSGKMDFSKQYFPLLPVMEEFVSEVLVIAEHMENNKGNAEAFYHNRCSCITKYNAKCLFYDVCLTKPSSRERILMSDLYIPTQLIYDEDKKSEIVI